MSVPRGGAGVAAAPPPLLDLDLPPLGPPVHHTFSWYITCLGLNTDTVLFMKVWR